MHPGPEPATQVESAALAPASSSGSREVRETRSRVRETGKRSGSDPQQSVYVCSNNCGPLVLPRLSSVPCASPRPLPPPRFLAALSQRRHSGALRLPPSVPGGTHWGEGIHWRHRPPFGRESPPPVGRLRLWFLAYDSTTRVRVPQSEICCGRSL